MFTSKNMLYFFALLLVLSNATNINHFRDEPNPKLLKGLTRQLSDLVLFFKK